MIDRGADCKGDGQSSRPSWRAYPHELERDVICADQLEVVCLCCPPNDYYPCDDTGAHEGVIFRTAAN